MGVGEVGLGGVEWERVGLGVGEMRGGGRPSMDGRL